MGESVVAVMSNSAPQENGRERALRSIVRVLTVDCRTDYDQPQCKMLSQRKT